MHRKEERKLQSQLYEERDNERQETEGIPREVISFRQMVYWKVLPITRFTEDYRIEKRIEEIYTKDSLSLIALLFPSSVY